MRFTCAPARPGRSIKNSDSAAERAMAAKKNREKGARTIFLLLARAVANQAAFRARLVQAPPERELQKEKHRLLQGPILNTQRVLLNVSEQLD
jgi:hypothetical protein